MDVPTNRRRRQHLPAWMVMAAVCVAAARLMGSTPQRQVIPASSNAFAVFATLIPQEAAESEQAASEAAENGEGEAEEPSLMEEVFHWFNFLLVAGGLAFLVKRLLVPFLEERGRLIREDMDRSAKALADANQRLAAIEDKLKSMDEEMASLRQAAFHESTAERGRIEQAATTEAGKILSTAEQEIEAAVKAARQDLKRYTAELALGMAERRIRDSLTSASEGRIVQTFVKELAAGSENGPARQPEPPAN